MFIATWFIIVPKWKQLKSTSSGSWMNYKIQNRTLHRDYCYTQGIDEFHRRKLSKRSQTKKKKKENIRYDFISTKFDSRWFCGDRSQNSGYLQRGIKDGEMQEGSFGVLVCSISCFGQCFHGHVHLLKIFIALSIEDLCHLLYHAVLRYKSLLKTTNAGPQTSLCTNWTRM